METREKNVEQVIAAIQTLNLDPIKFKLMNREEGEGWTREEADYQEHEYKRFLTLMAKYPEQAIVPNKSTDKFWHTHILDTLKYAEDCQNVFGHFLHHFPYFGLRDAEDAANLATAAADTQRLYKEEFGQEMNAETSVCARQSSSVCARNASSVCARNASSVCARNASSVCASNVEFWTNAMPNKHSAPLSAPH